MAIEVRQGGAWKVVSGMWVRQGTKWEPTRYILMADGEYVTNPWDYDQGPPPQGYVETRASIWKVIRAFEPPNEKPPTPFLDPKPESEQRDPPPRIDAKIVVGSVPFDDWIKRSWTRELYFSYDGGPFIKWSDVDPDVAEFVEVWTRPPTSLRARLRYTNEAGGGLWGDPSNAIDVHPGGY